MDSFAVSVFFQSLLYHGTLCASFLTNFHFVTSSLARWRCQSGSTLGRPTTGLFSNSFSISCLLYPVLKAIELLFTGKSLPPMMRIGSTSAQLPWPATCTSGLASFYTFCAPYRSLRDVSLKKRLFFYKSYKRRLTPPPCFYKVMLRFFLKKCQNCENVRHNKRGF